MEARYLSNSSSETVSALVSKKSKEGERLLHLLLHKRVRSPSLGSKFLIPTAFFLCSGFIIPRTCDYVNDASMAGTEDEYKGG